MKQYTLLSDLCCLNELVYNKVVIIRGDSYRMYNFGRYTNAPKDFNPFNYALLETDDYAVIVDAPFKLQEQHLVNKIWRKQCGHDTTSNLVDRKYNVGDRVHLTCNEGIYTIVKAFDKNTYSLTCNTWKYTDRPYRTFDISMIKCLAGGVNNLKRS